MLQSRLLDTAIAHFGRLGFDGASTREIARASATAMSSITYHFGGKEGLYLAAADHIAEGVRERLAPQLARLQVASDGGELTPHAARDCLLAMLDSFAEMMLHPASEDWARFIVREQQAPTGAFERLYHGVMRDMIDAFTRLAAIARPDLGLRQVKALTILLYGQAIILRIGRASLCRTLEVEAMGPAEGTLLRDQLRAAATCILDGGPK